MAKAIKLSDKLVDAATLAGGGFDRSPSKQIEYWASIGKAAEENPDLTFASIKNIFTGIKEASVGEISDYEFTETVASKPKLMELASQQLKETIKDTMKTHKSLNNTLDKLKKKP